MALSWDEKHTMILPKGHHVSQFLVHETAADSGREQTLSELRRMFWIIAGRSLVKRTMPKTECQTRGTGHGTLSQGEVGSLSSSVYLLGPLTVKWGHETAKRWGCLLTFLTTHAVNLEVTPRFYYDSLTVY